MQKTDLLLVRPINPDIQNIIPNIGLGHLSSAVKKAGFSVRVLDCVKEGFNFSRFERFLKENEFRIIGFQAFTFDLPAIRTSAEICKRVSPGSVLIIGGPHPSGDPYNIFRFIPQADYAFKGEAEESLPLFMEKIINGRDIGNAEVPGLIWKYGAQVIANPITPPPDLDALGVPDWTAINPLEYPLQPHGIFIRRPPTAPIITSRGCPYLCTFCAGREVSGLKIRRRSVDSVIEEILLLNKRFGVQEIHIEDDNFTLDRNYVLAFCAQLRKSIPAIVWALPNGVRLDSLDEQLLLTMKSAGCYSFAVGIESGSQRILDLTKKQLTIKTVKEKTALIHKCGIKTTGFFILGLPGESRQDMEATLALALALPLDRADFSIFIPLPGTKEYTALVSETAFNMETFRSYTALKAVRNYTKTDISLVEAFQKRCFAKFYLRPRIIISFISEIKSFTHLKYFLFRVLRLLK